MKIPVGITETENFFAALTDGKVNEVTILIQEAIKSGQSAEVVLKGGLIPAMEQIGKKFKKGEIYLPEVLLAARAMHAGMSILKPILSQYSGGMMGKVVIGTVKGDLHDIGKNLVAMMLEGGGFEVVDLGVDVPSEEFYEAIKKYQPQAIGMSALLATTMMEMRNTIELIKKAGLRDRVKTIIGGAPVTESFAKEIDADGYAPDAATAVDKVRALLSIQ